jgi:hypothetical protein
VNQRLKKARSVLKHNMYCAVPLLATRWRPGAHIQPRPHPRVSSGLARLQGARTSRARASSRCCGRVCRTSVAAHPCSGRGVEVPNPCGSCFPLRARPEVRAERRLRGPVFPGAAVAGESEEAASGPLAPPSGAAGGPTRRVGASARGTGTWCLGVAGHSRVGAWAVTSGAPPRSGFPLGWTRGMVCPGSTVAYQL